MTEPSVPQSPPAAVPTTAPAASPPRQPRPRRNWKSLGVMALTIGLVAAGTFGVWLGRETAPTGAADASSAATSFQPTVTPDSGSSRNLPGNFPSGGSSGGTGGSNLPSGGSTGSCPAGSGSARPGRRTGCRTSTR